MKTTAELLAESRSLRFSFTKPDTVAEQTFSVLRWTYYYGQVLGAVGSSVWLHLYLPDYQLEEIKGVTTIIHGHNAEEHCVTKTLCHVLGYKPNGDLPPLLQKQWERFEYDKG